MTTPLIAGVSIAVAAVGLRAGIQQFIKYQAMPKKLNYYKGGFLPEMTRREASLILGVRESAAEERVKEAHRRIMIANHPDAGGSSYVAAKVNEAKDMMLGKSSKAGMF